jgi:hypothetical protein
MRLSKLMRSFDFGVELWFYLALSLLELMHKLVLAEFCWEKPPIFSFILILHLLEIDYSVLLGSTEEIFYPNDSRRRISDCFSFSVASSCCRSLRLIWSRLDRCWWWVPSRSRKNANYSSRRCWFCNFFSYLKEGVRFVKVYSKVAYCFLEESLSEPMQRVDLFYLYHFDLTMYFLYFLLSVLASTSSLYFKFHLFISKATILKNT